MKIIIGKGAGISATKGAKIVKILAVKIQIPKADAANKVGNIVAVETEHLVNKQLQPIRDTTQNKGIKAMLFCKKIIKVPPKT